MKPSHKKVNTPHSNKRKSPPKKSPLDVAPKNEVKEMFLNWFRKNNNIGQVMTKQDVVRNVLTKLNAKQDDALEEAMNELKSEGIIEIEEGTLNLILTKVGVASI